jgi:hypothetical protein
MILMIDSCNSYANLSIITATGVFLYVFSSVPYSTLTLFSKIIIIIIITYAKRA